MPEMMFGYSLEITIKSTGDKLVIEDFINYFDITGENAKEPIISAILFADGVVWDSSDVVDKFSTNIIIGSGDDDFLNGHVMMNNTISGGAGNDEIMGYDGNDSLYGGRGNDKINSGNGVDFIDPDGGNDEIVLGDGKKTIRFAKGFGNDSVRFYRGIEQKDLTVEMIRSEEDDILIKAKDGVVVLGWKDSSETLTITADTPVEEWLKISLSNDELLEGTTLLEKIETDKVMPNTILGTEGSDRYFGMQSTENVDRYFGENGSDLFDLRNRYNDLNRDEVYGGKGNDFITLKGGNFFVAGDEGTDKYSIMSPGGNVEINLDSNDTCMDILDISHSKLNDFNITVIDDVIRFDHKYIDNTIIVKGFYDVESKSLKLGQLRLFSEWNGWINSMLTVDLLRDLDCSRSLHAQAVLNDYDQGVMNIKQELDLNGAIPDTVDLSIYGSNENVNLVITGADYDDIKFDAIYGGIMITNKLNGFRSEVMLNAISEDIAVTIGEKKLLMRDIWENMQLENSATSGDDTLITFSDDIVEGKSGNDVIYCMNNSNSTMYGNDGNDVLEGYDGEDTMYGGDDHDFLYGYAGDDKLYGGNGNDELYGYDGDDHLYGGTGNDHMNGGEGNDVYFFISGFGENTIMEEGGNDKLVFYSNYQDMYFATENSRKYEFSINSIDNKDSVKFSYIGNGIEEVCFENGKIDCRQINLLIQSMNEFVATKGVSSWSEAYREFSSEAEMLISSYISPLDVQ